jgi:hypothetical protein
VAAGTPSSLVGWESAQDVLPLLCPPGTARSVVRPSSGCDRVGCPGGARKAPDLYLGDS